MSTRLVTYYQIVCDHPDCDYSTEDDGSDFSAWSDASVAQEDWEGGHQVIEVDVRSVLLPGDDPHAPIELDALTIHLCDEHRVDVDR